MDGWLVGWLYVICVYDGEFSGPLHHCWLLLFSFSVWITLPDTFRFLLYNEYVYIYIFGLNGTHQYSSKVAVQWTSFLDVVYLLFRIAFFVVNSGALFYSYVISQVYHLCEEQVTTHMYAHKNGGISSYVAHIRVFPTEIWIYSGQLNSIISSLDRLYGRFFNAYIFVSNESSICCILNAHLA